MAFWRVLIEKYLNSDVWNNAYIVKAATLADAVTVADQLGSFEQQIHSDTVTLRRQIISTLGSDGRTFQEVAMGGTGNISSSGAEFLPLRTTVNLKLYPDGLGDPGRKYYHLRIAESSQANGSLLTGSGTHYAAIVSAATTYLLPLLASDNLYITAARAAASYALQSLLGDHQFNRKWARRNPAP